MDDRTIDNPVTGQRVVFIETARESGGARTVLDVETTPGGELRPSGLPRRFADLALLADWDPSLLAVGARRLLAPLMRWSARRARAHGRAAELLRRYGGSDPSLR
jgi:hypothetical protein